MTTATEVPTMTTDPEAAEPGVGTPAGSPVAKALAPLAIDVALPIAAYFLAKDAFHASTLTAYLVSSVVPVVRTVAEFAGARKVNALAVLMLAVNLAGIVLTLVTGSIRLGTAKSAAVSGVVALGLIISARRGKPVLADGMQVWLTRGDRARTAAWDRLHAADARFQQLECRFTAIFGAALLAECCARVVLAWVAPVSTLGWLPTLVLVGGIVAACIVGGGVAADPMTAMIDADADAAAAENGDDVTA